MVTEVSGDPGRGRTSSSSFRIAGSSGAGKSTLLHLMGLPDAPIRLAHIGFVFQIYP